MFSDCLGEVNFCPVKVNTGCLSVPPEGSILLMINSPLVPGVSVPLDQNSVKHSQLVSPDLSSFISSRPCLTHSHIHIPPHSNESIVSGGFPHDPLTASPTSSTLSVAVWKIRWNVQVEFRPRHSGVCRSSYCERIISGFAKWWQKAKLWSGLITRICQYHTFLFVSWVECFSCKRRKHPRQCELSSHERTEMRKLRLVEGKVSFLPKRGWGIQSGLIDRGLKRGIFSAFVSLRFEAKVKSSE